MKNDKNKIINSILKEKIKLNNDYDFRHLTKSKPSIIEKSNNLKNSKIKDDTKYKPTYSINKNFNQLDQKKGVFNASNINNNYSFTTDKLLTTVNNLQNFIGIKEKGRLNETKLNLRNEFFQITEKETNNFLSIFIITLGPFPLSSKFSNASKIGSAKYISRVNLISPHHRTTKSDTSGVFKLSEYININPTFVNKPISTSRTPMTPNKNINFAYSELAKQLKNNKTTTSSVNNTSRLKANYYTSEKIMDNNFKFKSTDTPANPITNKPTSSKVNSRANLNSTTGFTKTTKDNSIASLKMSYNNSFKMKNLEIESPEELHIFYVSMFQQNKSLAFKFENQKKEIDIMDDFMDN